MKCFMPMDEETILRLWIRNPKLVAPFSRPFYRGAYLGERKRQNKAVGHVSNSFPSSHKSA